jgi:hypothetical protein
MPLDPAQSHGHDEVSLRYSYRQHAGVERSDRLIAVVSARRFGPDGWPGDANGPDRLATGRLIWHGTSTSDSVEMRIFC